MKKTVTILVVLLGLMLAATAFVCATDVPKVYSVDAEDGSYDVTVSDGITSGNQYVLWVVRDATEGSDFPAAITADQILYIDQKEATSTSLAFDDFIPMAASNNNKVFLSGEGMSEPRYLGKLQVTGFSVRGTMKAWNNTDDAVIRLYPSATTDPEITADIKADNPASGNPATKGSITAKDGGTYSQSFSVDGIQAGSYKLAIFKPGKYVSKIISVEIVNEDRSLEEIGMWLYGDVNGDGSVIAADATEVLKKAAMIPNAIDSATDKTGCEACAKITGDEDIDGADATQILRYCAKLSSSFDSFR